jgi:putative membrane protein
VDGKALFLPGGITFDAAAKCVERRGNQGSRFSFSPGEETNQEIPMQRRLWGAASALCLFAAAAQAADTDSKARGPAPGSRSETMSAVKDSASAMAGTISAEMTSTTKGFVTAAATSDMYEVQAGQIAQQRASSPAVRDFAAEMVKAHTATTAQLKSIIASNNINVTPPASLDTRRQSMIDNLKGAKAQDFDHRYLEQQEAAHKEAQILMRGYAKDGDNAAIKKFAAETLPKVEQHLKMVQDLEAKDKSASR